MAQTEAHIGDPVALTGSGHHAGSGDVRGRIVRIHTTTAGDFARVRWHSGIETVIPVSALAAIRKRSASQGES